MPLRIVGRLAFGAALCRSPATPHLATAAQVDPRPTGTSKGVPLRIVGRLAFGAALCGASPLAQSAAARAAGAQELPPRAWAELARLALALADAKMPEGAPPPGASKGVSEFQSPLLNKPVMALQHP